VRIACELADAETGRHVWADRFDGDLTELFDLQDRATTAVASAVEPNLERAEIERVRHKSTESLGAYDLHLRAISGLESGTEEGTAEAVGLLRRALALDPDYALALADLALCVLSRARAGWQEDSEAGFQEAVALARRALGADRSDAFVLAAAGYVFSVTLRAHEESAELAERAIALNGNSAFVWELSGAISLNAGEFEEAIRRQEMVMRLDPLSTASRNAQTGMALAHFFSRRFEEAERWARRALAARPALISARNLLAASVAMQGRGGEARALMADIRAGNAQASLSRARRLNGFRHGWMTELWVEALQRAGVPE
jgi:adenylate cyclase